MKTIIIALNCFIIGNLCGQEVKMQLAGKEYDVCTSIAYAEHLNPDSVKGFSLQSKGYKDFPKDILKYKNIVVLDLSSKQLDEMVEYLNRSEKRIYKKRKLNGGKQFGYPLFRPNKVISIPDEIVGLKKLELIHLMDMFVTIDAIKKIEKLLPNCEVVPSSKDLENEQEWQNHK